jgi:hypothetical protein
VPSNTPYTSIYYTNYKYADDLTLLFDTVKVPPRFYDALTSGIAARLATKFAPERYSMMKAQADEAYAIAARTDYEDVPLEIAPDLTSYGGY